jgi:hypothetical protein
MNKPNHIGAGLYSYLSKTELRQLRLVCRFTRLGFEALAARPEVARKLIEKHLSNARTWAAIQDMERR